MGEGKVDVFPDFVLEHFGVGKSEPSCVICSRIAIDKNSLDKVNLGNMNLVKYMREYAAPGKEESYAQYIADQPYSAPIKIDSNTEIEVYSLIEEKDKDDEIVLVPKIEKVELAEDVGDDDLNGETAVLFMQVTGPQSGLKVLANDGKALGAAAGLSLFTAPIQTIKAAPVIGKAAISPAGLFTLAVLGISQQLNVGYNRAVTATYCGDVPTSTSDLETGSKEGCSVVRTTNYNVENILQYCRVIESIP